MAQNPLRADSAHANPVGRREALAALALSQFATPVAGATQCVGVTLLGPQDWLAALSASRAADATFWQLHDAWQTIATAWKRTIATGPDMDNDTFDWWGDRHSISYNAMMIARVTTLPALYAKMEACDGEPENTIGGPAGASRFQLLMWDVLALIANGGAA